MGEKQSTEHDGLLLRSVWNITPSKPSGIKLVLGVCR